MNNVLFYGLVARLYTDSPAVVFEVYFALVKLSLSELYYRLTNGTSRADQLDCDCNLFLIHFCRNITTLLFSSIEFELLADYYKPIKFDRSCHQILDNKYFLFIALV